MTTTERGTRPVAGSVIERLKAVVGPGGYLDEPSDIDPYCRAWRDPWHGRVPLLLRPSSTADVARIVEICAETRTAIVPQGGNTGLTGASQPHEDMSEVIVSTSRLKRVLEVDILNDTITVEAGIVLAEVQNIAADQNECTSDSCDPNTGCAHISKSCSDGNACTADACDPSTGGCFR